MSIKIAEANKFKVVRRKESHREEEGRATMMFTKQARVTRYFPPTVST